MPIATLADAMSTYWVNFITTGDPNGHGLPTWRAVRRSRPSRISSWRARSAVGNHLLKRELDFLERGARATAVDVYRHVTARRLRIHLTAHVLEFGAHVRPRLIIASPLSHPSPVSSAPRIKRRPAAASRTRGSTRAAGQSDRRRRRQIRRRPSRRNRRRPPGTPLYISPGIVQLIQQKLLAMGHPVPTISGAWGDNSAAALAQFQTKQGLDPGGDLDELTLIALGHAASADAVKCRRAAMRRSAHRQPPAAARRSRRARG